MAPSQPEWTLVDFVRTFYLTAHTDMSPELVYRSTEDRGGRACREPLARAASDISLVHRHSGILLLNICLILPLLTAWSNGLDSSLINGLQILPAWQEYFHWPNGKVLGLLNSSQNIGSLCVPSFPPVSSIR
jgi:hypothetical protein